MREIRYLEKEEREMIDNNTRHRLFPWFGAKWLIAQQVWLRLGRDARNFIDPFMGSMAFLLSRPWGPAECETVGDVDGMLANFWRSVQHCPELVVRYAVDLACEHDLVARNRYLAEMRPLIAEYLTDPLWFDVQLAGWWFHGQMHAIARWSLDPSPRLMMPRPRRVPRFDELLERVASVRERLRYTRVYCDDWGRVLRSGTNTTGRGVTAVVLDPPYSASTGRSVGLYDGDETGNEIALDVRDWALANGDNPSMRIAIFGYREEHDEYMPEGWTRLHWRAAGGFSLTGDGKGRARAKRETVWFSPHCVRVRGGGRPFENSSGEEEAA